MTKKQLAEMIRAQRPEPGEGFEARLEREIERLKKEEMSMRRKYKRSTLLIAAVLTALMVAGAAIAAGELRLFDALFSKTAVKDAGNRIVTDLGVAENALAEVQVEEAVYDGRTLALVLGIAAKNPEADAMTFVSWSAENNTDDYYIIERTEHEDGSGTQRLLGRKDGKRILFYSGSVFVNGEELKDRRSMEAECLPDGSARMWLQYDLGELKNETSLQCELLMRIRPMESEEASALEPVGFTLEKKKDERSFRLVPETDAKGERFEIEGAYITFAKVAAWLTVDYTYQQAADEGMGINFRLMDSEGRLLHMVSGETKTIAAGRYRQLDEVQSLSEIPERLYLEAKVIGENKTLGKAAFTLQEIDESEIPQPEFADAEPIGTELMILPEGEAQGESITLLWGRILPGRRVEITYAYDGDRRDPIDVVLKDPSGAPLGETLTFLCVVKEDCFTVNMQLDGSGWPTDALVEFVKDGKTLDSFPVRLSRMSES